MPLSFLSHNIEFEKACIRFNDSFSLLDIDWKLEPKQVWAILGSSGAGKSALATALTGAGELYSGTLSGIVENAAIVSLESQAALIERERLRDDSDLTDKVCEGTLVKEMLDEASTDPEMQAKLVDMFSLGSLLNRGFRKLSTGETRKLLITRALSSKPSLVVIDGPFEGLDTRTVSLLCDVLQQLSAQTSLVMVINRMDEIPGFVTHIAVLQNAHLTFSAETNDEDALNLIDQFFHLKSKKIGIPDALPGETSRELNGDDPLVNIKNAAIRYTNNRVFEHLDWRIEPGQHWQLTGPNGSGKTCLLNLITGDHPQCYSNDIFVCGYQRGHGESIWDIKQHIGFVSSALQWDYRVSINCRNVIISGFYDSIGLYSKATDVQIEKADQWLELMGLHDRALQPFNQCCHADQRLLLIARAMVKHPHLLILDEPCFGLGDICRQLVLALIEKICTGSETTVIYVNHHARDRIEGIENHLALN